MMTLRVLAEFYKLKNGSHFLVLFYHVVVVQFEDLSRNSIFSAALHTQLLFLRSPAEDN
jgi:hypothetical protein